MLGGFKFCESSLSPVRALERVFSTFLFIIVFGYNHRIKDARKMQLTYFEKFKGRFFYRKLEIFHEIIRNDKLNFLGVNECSEDIYIGRFFYCAYLSMNFENSIQILFLEGRQTTIFSNGQITTTIYSNGYLNVVKKKILLVHKVEFLELPAL